MRKIFKKLWVNWTLLQLYPYVGFITNERTGQRIDLRMQMTRVEGSPLEPESSRTVTRTLEI